MDSTQDSNVEQSAVSDGARLAFKIALLALKIVVVILLGVQGQKFFYEGF